MKKLFQKVKEWLRSRVTAFAKVKGYSLRVKGGSRGLHENVDVDENVAKGKGMCASRGSHSTGNEVEVFPPWGNKRWAVPHSSSTDSLLLRAEEYITAHYDVRYNRLSRDCSTIFVSWVESNCFKISKVNDCKLR